MTVIHVVVYREPDLPLWSVVWRGHMGQVSASYASRPAARRLAMDIAARKGCRVHELLPGGQWRVL